MHNIVCDSVVINNDREIIVGNNVWVGARYTILKGISVGNNRILVANSNVVCHVTDNTIVGGNPTKK